MAFQEIIPGVYELGSGRNKAVGLFGGIFSTTLNTRDLGNAGGADFLLLGPGSSVWMLCYAVHIDAPGATPADQLGLELQVGGSFDTGVPFTFQNVQTMRLPVYGTGTLTYDYSGRVRLEFPAGTFSIINGTGQALTVNFQFWGKAI